MKRYIYCTSGDNRYKKGWVRGCREEARMQSYYKNGGSERASLVR